MFKELQINCIDNNNLSCLERPIATVLNWRNVDYRVIFLSSWTFSFNYMEHFHGIRNVPELQALLYNSQRFTGVVFNVKNLPTKMKKMQICNEIINGNPVIIYIDSFWCPWFPSYHKSHIHHYIIVVGINTDKEYFICLDKLDAQEKVILPFKDFFKGSGEVIVLETKNNVDLNNNINSLKSECYKTLCPATLKRNIEEFASNVRNNIDVAKQIKDYHDAKVSPLYTWLKGISNDRLNFADCLEMFIDNKKYCYYRDGLKTISDSWRNIIILLIRAGSREYNEPTYKIIAGRIEQIAKMESNLMQQLKEELKDV